MADRETTILPFTTDRERPGEPLRLAADHLVKVYKGRRVVRGVSVDIRQGEIVGLLGPNGAGKTTTFYMIVGLVRPDEGRVILGNEDITDLPMYLRAQRGISYLPQEPSVFRKLTVEENLLSVFETMDLPLAEREARLFSKNLESRTSPEIALIRSPAARGGAWKSRGLWQLTRHLSCLMNPSQESILLRSSRSSELFPSCVREESES